MRETCERDDCWCCGHGHQCEPPDYPKGGDQEWTCPDCHRRYVAFLVNDDPRYMDLVGKYLTGQTWGWRSTPAAQPDPGGVTEGEER